jgi:hypothetical protein
MRLRLASGWAFAMGLPLVSATSQSAAFRQKGALERLHREPIAIRVLRRAQKGRAPAMTRGSKFKDRANGETKKRLRPRRKGKRYPDELSSRV